MKIAYHLDEADVVALHVHVTETGIRLRPLLAIVAAAVAGALYWIVSAGTGSALAGLVTGVGGGVAYAAIAPRLLRGVVARLVGRRLRAAPSGMLGDRELELTDHALVDRSVTGEASTALGAIRTIVQRDDRAFIFVATDLAYILPRGSVREGSYDGFLASLQSAVARARN